MDAKLDKLGRSFWLTFSRVPCLECMRADIQHQRTDLVAAVHR